MNSPCNTAAAGLNDLGEVLLMIVLVSVYKTVVMLSLDMKNERGEDDQVVSDGSATSPDTGHT